MVGRVRLTYETGDGKRHWVKAFVPALGLPEGVVFAREDGGIASRNRSPEHAAMTAPTDDVSGLVLGQQRAVSDSADIRRRSTNRQELLREERTRVRSSADSTPSRIASGGVGCESDPAILNGSVVA
jgi:hypothetical protein